MSDTAVSARTALINTLAAGFAGTYDALAELAGVRPEAAQATLKELSREGKACVSGRQRRAGKAGAAPAVYAARRPTFDSLGFTLQVWR